MTFLPSSQRGKTRLLWRSVGRAGRPEPKNYQKVNALRLPRRRPDRDGAILVDKSCYGTSAPALRSDIQGERHRQSRSFGTPPSNTQPASDSDKRWLFPIGLGQMLAFLSTVHGFAARVPEFANWRRELTLNYTARRSWQVPPAFPQPWRVGRLGWSPVLVAVQMPA